MSETVSIWFWGGPWAGSRHELRTPLPEVVEVPVPPMLSRIPARIGEVRVARYRLREYRGGLREYQLMLEQR